MRKRVSAVLLLTLVFGFSSHALAELDIVLNYQESRSRPPDDDPGGHLLQEIMERAASEWEAFFPNTTDTIQINYRYRNETDLWWDGDRGSHLAATRRFSDSSFTIRFDTLDGDRKEIPWFMDVTPEDDSEFDLQPTFAYEEDDEWYLNRHDLMEIKYGGPAVNPAAEGCHDMLSVALHEIGHALLSPGEGEMRSTGYLSVDGDYMSRFIGGGGADMMILAAEGAHFEASTLMASYFPRGIRRLPSAPEILAAATLRGWGRVALPRAELLQTPVVGEEYDWEDWRVWLSEQPGPSPGIRDENLPTEILLYGGHTFKNLTLSHAGPDDVTDNVIQLTIVGLATVGDRILVELPFLEGTDPLERRSGVTRLFLSPGARAGFNRLEIDSALVQVESNASLRGHPRVGRDSRVEVRDGGLLALSGTDAANPAMLVNDQGVTELTAGTLSLAHAEASCHSVLIDQDSEVAGFGSVDSIVWLFNDGLIKAQNGDLVFSTVGGGTMDLDGDTLEQGVVDATEGSIRFEGEIADPFKGTMTVGRSIAFDSEWILDMGGRLDFIFDGAHIEGPGVDVRSYAEITCPVNAAIRAPVTFEPVALITVDGQLALHGFTVFDEANVYGRGTLTQIGDAIMQGSVSILTGGYAMDGDRLDGTTYVPGSSQVQVDSFAELTVRGEVGVRPSDGYDGDLVIEDNATVRFTEPFQLDPGGSITIGENSVIEFFGGLHNDGTIDGTGKIKTPDGAVSGSGTLTVAVDSL